MKISKLILLISLIFGIITLLLFLLSYFYTFNLPLSLIIWLRTLCLICFMSVQLSGIKTIKHITKMHNTGDLSPLPFISLAVCGWVWFWYGVLVNDTTIYVSNLSAVLFGAYYTYIFHKNTNRRMEKFYLPAATTSFITLMLVIFLPNTAQSYVGFIGCCMAVLLLSSPLAVMKTVLNERSTTSMPFMTSVTSFYNALAWTLYGITVKHDRMISVPNAFGLAACLVQLVLFLLFDLPSSSSSTVGYSTLPTTEVV